MSFSVSAEQFKKVFGGEQNLSEIFIKELKSYLKKRLIVRRLRLMYEWISSGGELSVFTCRSDLVESMGEKMNLSKIPFVAVTDRTGHHGFLIKRDTENAVKDATKELQEELGFTCTITSMEGLKEILQKSKHQSKGIISITGLTPAQLCILEQLCITKLNPEAIGEDFMEDGTYRFTMHGASAIKKKNSLGLCLMEMMLQTTGKNAEKNIEKASNKMQFISKSAMSFNMDIEKQAPPVYITGNDNQYMKVSQYGFEYGHAVKENGQLKLIKDTECDRRLPDYEIQELSYTSRFEDPSCTTDIAMMMAALQAAISSRFISTDERDINAGEKAIAGKINDMVLKKTETDSVMQAQGQWASKTSHLAVEMGKVLEAMAGGSIPPGYERADMMELSSGMNLNGLSPDDYKGISTIMRGIEIVAVENIYDRINVRDSLGDTPITHTSAHEEKETER